MLCCVRLVIKRSCAIVSSCGTRSTAMMMTDCAANVSIAALHCTAQWAVLMCYSVDISRAIYHCWYQLRNRKTKKSEWKRIDQHCCRGNGSVLSTRCHSKKKKRKITKKKQKKRERGTNRLTCTAVEEVFILLSTYVRVRNVDTESENAATVVELKDVGVTFGVDVVSCKTE